jgi:ATP-binding protein involved in chromosome partitioning
MEDIAHKLLVLSGKGGVGKSTIAANLALWLSMQRKNVGLLDIDVHGPSVPKLLNLKGQRVLAEGQKIRPISYSDTLKIMSIGFLLPEDSDAVIWRGPMKHNLIRQFIADVLWGRLDYLVVDCPPGTGDEPLSVVQLLKNADGAIVVTTPQQLSIIDVKKCITFCRQLNLPVLGVIENMSGFVCPHCGHKTDIFRSKGGRRMAEEFNVPFLGSIPIDPSIVSACDAGQPLVSYNSQSRTAQALQHVFEQLLQPDTKTQNNKEVQDRMRIAIPLTDGRLSSHFGHCEQFAIVDADPAGKMVMNIEILTPPAHEPGILPKWLSGMQVNVVIAGGMGRRAQQHFEESNIDVVVGAEENTPQELVTQYLSGQLQYGQNICDH